MPEHGSQEKYYACTVFRFRGQSVGLISSILLSLARDRWRRRVSNGF
jgi:hypothetical protein